MPLYTDRDEEKDIEVKFTRYSQIADICGFMVIGSFIVFIACILLIVLGASPNWWIGAAASAFVFLASLIIGIPIDIKCQEIKRKQNW